jgi:hypothetical protein
LGLFGSRWEQLPGQFLGEVWVIARSPRSHSPDNPNTARAGVSGYDIRSWRPICCPTPDEAARFIAQTELRHPAAADVQARIDAWNRPSAG